MTAVSHLLPEILLKAARRRRSGLVLNYHALSPRVVRLHVELLARHFDFVSHDEFLERLCERRASRPFCLLTFDDGKKSHATAIAPTLREAGVPAVFYVPTGFVSDGNRALWFDRVAALHARVPALRGTLPLDALKRLPHSVRDRQVDEACQRTGIDADLTNDDVRPMSWADARALDRDGFTIGSHSEWHAVLTCEPVERAKADIAGSMRRVSEELGARCVSFSFPNGSYTEDLARHAAACGAATVFTTEPLWTEPDASRWRLPRVQLFGHGTAWSVALKIAAARVPGLLANPDGTGRSYARRHRLPARVS